MLESDHCPMLNRELGEDQVKREQSVKNLIVHHVAHWMIVKDVEVEVGVITSVAQSGLIKARETIIIFYVVVVVAVAISAIGGMNNF